jgi:hypothetical protein
MQEQWLPIPEWEGIYSASNLGRLRSEERIISRTDGKTQLVRERILKLVPDRKGYLRSQLFRNNVGYTRYAHQMVMAAFVGPQPDGLVCRHLNGNQLDNTVGNLRYGTDSENKLDTVLHGTHRNSRKTECPQKHPYSPENTYVDGHRRRHCRTCKGMRQLVSQ